MNRYLLSLITGAGLLFLSTLRAAETKTTPGGIAVDTPWKEKVQAFAREHCTNPSWGFSHFDRIALLCQQLAAAEGQAIDPDVLFAAAYLHDIGAYDPWGKVRPDHVDSAVEVVGGILEPMGFPMAKLPLVKEAIAAHHNVKVSKDTPFIAIAMHDADLLDFLGMIGAARIVKNRTGNLSEAYSLIEKYCNEYSLSLVSNTGKKLGGKRVAEMRDFLKAMKDESFDCKAL